MTHFLPLLLLPLFWSPLRSEINVPESLPTSAPLIPQLLHYSWFSWLTKQSIKLIAVSAISDNHGHVLLSIKSAFYRDSQVPQKSRCCGCGYPQQTLITVPLRESREHIFTDDWEKSLIVSNGIYIYIYGSMHRKGIPLPSEGEIHKFPSWAHNRIHPVTIYTN